MPDNSNQLMLMPSINLISVSSICNSLFATTSSQDMAAFITGSLRISRSFVSFHFIVEFLDRALQSHSFSLFWKIKSKVIFVPVFDDNACQSHFSSMKLLTILSSMFISSLVDISLKFRRSLYLRKYFPL